MLKSFKGKLREEITVPSFLGDISHQFKFVVRNLFSSVNDGRAQQCGCTKSDVLRLSKYWRCIIRKNRSKSSVKLKEERKFSFEHIFNYHVHCIT